MSTKVLLKKSSVLGKVPLATDLSYGELALNYADGKLYFKDSNNNVKSFTEDSSVVTLAGTQSLSNKTLVDPLVEGKLTAKAAGGDEGGELLLEKAVTNTTIAGSGVTIDIYQNKLRIFETGGTNRGVYIDITAATSSVGTNLLTGSSGGTGPDADTLDGFDSSYFLNYNNLLNKPTIPTLVSQLTNDSGYLTSYTETDPIYTASSWYTTQNNSSNWNTAYGWGDHSTQGYLTTVGWNDVTGKPTFATVATSGSYTDLINTPTIFSGDYNDLSNKPNLVKAAVKWTANHTLADGTRYLAGDVVYDNGNIFVANFDNESLPTSNTTYWTDLGTGNRLNIDGRDIPNITYAQLTGAPNVPTTTSELTNDSGYITSLDLIGYATESSVTTQLASKQDTLVSGTNIKTINGQSLLGSGDIVITGGITSESDPVYATSSWYTTTNNSGNWDTAYGWGNHASVGYLTSTSSIDWSQIINEPALFSGDYNDLTNKPTIPTVPSNVSEFTNDAGYLTDIKTINGQSLVGTGNISITGGGSLYTNTATTTTTAPSQVVDSFALTEYRTVKYLIQATSASEVHSVEVTLMHNDVNVFATVYNVMFSGAAKLFEVGSSINGTNVDLTVTPLVAGLTIDVTRISLVTRPFTSTEFVWPTDLETQTLTEIDLETQTYPTKDLN